MPSTGNLEVKIRNPTKETYKVYVYFDSFFWLMKIEGQDYNINRGSSNSMCFGRKALKPGETLNLSIGYHDAQYKPRDEFMNHPLLKDRNYTMNVPPCERKNYIYERPEGVLIVKYHVNGIAQECSEKDYECGIFTELYECNEKKYLDKNPMKKMDLHLKDETEEYQKYREQFEEIRKEQARRARWGYVLVNEDCITHERFRDIDGTIREFVGVRCRDDWAWDAPLDFKELDLLSDDEILKMRMEKKQNIAEIKKREQEEVEEEAERDFEKWKEEEERIKKEAEEKKKEEEEAAAGAAAKEKTKIKTVEKSKPLEVPPRKVPSLPKQKSTKSKVSVAPPKADVLLENKKSDEKPNATKNKKKKKTKLCCTLM